jgi:CRP-like cAMP-binding protein
MMIVSKQNLRALTKEMFLNLMNEKGLAALEIIRNFNKKERETMTRRYKLEMSLTTYEVMMIILMLNGVTTTMKHKKNHFMNGVRCMTI